MNCIKSFLPIIFLLLTLSSTNAQNNALDFDGSGDYIGTSIPAGTITGAYTIEYYLQLQSYPGSWGSLWNFDGSGWTPWFGVDNDGSLEMWDGASIIMDSGSGNVLNLGQWYHIAYVWDGTEGRIYLDGVEVDSDTTAPTPPDGDLQIGASGGTSGSFAIDALLDEMMISNTAIYTTNFTPDPCSAFTATANTVALYHFDEGTGQTATDSANNFDLQLGDNNAPIGDSNDPAWITSSLSPEIIITETSANISNDGTICSGSSVTLEVTGTSASSFTWSNGGGNSSSATFSPTSTTTYSVTFNDASCGGSTTLTQEVTVLNLPTASFTIGTNPVTVGNSSIITNTSTNGSGNINAWSWNFGTGSSPNTAISVGPHNVSYSTEGTSSICLTVTDDNGCVSPVSCSNIVIQSACDANAGTWTP